MALRDVAAPAGRRRRRGLVRRRGAEPAQITLELFPGDEALADQLGELDRRLEATVGGRWFAIREGDQVDSRAWMLWRDGVGQVEDVSTSASHRGRDSPGRSSAPAPSLARDRQRADLRHRGRRRDDLSYLKTGFEPIGFKRRFVKRLT